MREIKFRGRRIDNGEWVYGYLIGNEVIVGNVVEWDSEYFNTAFWMKVDPDTVGQYTGRKDRNETEIYEGDKTKDKWGNVGVIKYHNSWGCFYFSKSNVIQAVALWNDWNTLEVIDENPSLLGDTEVQGSGD
jgi:hypothetical protein